MRSSSPDGSKPALRARPVTAEELLAVKRVRDAAFGLAGASAPDPDHILQAKQRLRPLNRQVAVVDAQEQIVGGCLAYQMELSVPGGERVPVGALAGVGVLPTALGGGGLRAMMRSHLEQCLGHGDAASVLMSSESGLYGRFGYGAAVDVCEWHMRSDQMQLRIDVVLSEGSVELFTDAAEARDLLARAHDAAGQKQPGLLRRNDDWWELVLRPDVRDWIGGGPQFAAVHRDEHGDPDGYCLWRLDDSRTPPETASGHGRIHTTVAIHELVTASADAQSRLLSFLQTIPLTGDVVWEFAPVDPALRHQLVDPRQLWQHARLDMLWLRPLDIAALLRSRTWQNGPTVTLHVDDPMFPEIGGSFQLTAAADGSAQVARVESPADLSMTVADLGAIYLGGTSAMELLRANRISGAVEDIHRFDQLATTDQAPFTQTKF